MWQKKAIVCLGDDLEEKVMEQMQDSIVSLVEDIVKETIHNPVDKAYYLHIDNTLTDAGIEFTFRAIAKRNFELQNEFDNYEEDWWRDNWKGGW